MTHLLLQESGVLLSRGFGGLLIAGRQLLVLALNVIQGCLERLVLELHFVQLACIHDRQTLMLAANATLCLEPANLAVKLVHA